MIGPAGIQSFVAIHFRAGLRSYIADRLGVLHFVMDPEVAGAFIAHDIDHEWVFMVAFDPDAETVDHYPTERCERLVRAAIGDDDAEIEIVGAGTWHMTAQVADAMRRDRAFLLGDAAHRFPPTGGMGLNTGVADAHNLVWKLLAIEEGWASAALLDTYETERKPIAEINCQQSLTNAFKMVLLAQALQLHPGSTGADLAATLADPANREPIAAAVQEQATHFDMLGLQIGYTYPPHLTDPSEFVASAEVGARLPHAWLGDGRSTLDLVDRNELTLLTCGAHDEWAAAAANAAAPVRHVRLDEQAIDPTWSALCELGNDGALLVRPDQHVAWRSTDLPSDATAALATAIRSATAQ
jgi:hypothetical protein